MVFIHLAYLKLLWPTHNLHHSEQTVLTSSHVFQALDIIMESSDLPHRVLENTVRFRTRMTEAGFTLSVSLEITVKSKNLDSQKTLCNFSKI